MRILLALPAYVLGALGVRLGIALTGTGAWGRSRNPSDLGSRLGSARGLRDVPRQPKSRQSERRTRFQRTPPYRRRTENLRPRQTPRESDGLAMG